MNTDLFANVPIFCDSCRPEIIRAEKLAETGGIATFRCPRCGKIFRVLPPDTIHAAIGDLPIGYNVTVSWNENTSLPSLARWLRKQFADLRDMAPAKMIEKIRETSQLMVCCVSGEERDRLVESARLSGIDIEIQSVMSLADVDKRDTTDYIK